MGFRKLSGMEAYKYHLTEMMFARKMQAFSIDGIQEIVRNGGVKYHLTEKMFPRKMQAFLIDGIQEIVSVK